MKDKKTIWHEPTELPKDNTNVVVLGPMGYDGYRWLIEEHRDGYYQYENWEKWCYLDDLLELSNKVESLESEVSRYKNALEVARAEYLAIIDSEFDSGDGEQIKAFMANYDKLIQDTIKASQ